jgi:hypothetical protein
MGTRHLYLDSHQPFLCSVYASKNSWEPDIYIGFSPALALQCFPYASKKFLKILV